ncbi:MAG TPA: dihydrodipicolinate synthase family protein [Vicinamibacterales bacterium]|nr:dihydrodipicolinate synthase family protein [Vicinamibacterales bacterium]
MRFTGVLAPIPTPFDRHDELDTARWKGAFRRWLASPLRGFVVLGSNGEAVLLDENETDRAIAAARDLVPRDRLFIVGTGRESTNAAVRAAKRAAELGADAVLVRTPGFFKSQMTSDILIRHYKIVADASPVPVLLYNFTAVTGVNLLPSAVADLAHHPNIAGIKESGGDIGQISDLVSGTPDDFSVLAGSGATFYPALTVGASGGILALAGVLPDACVRLFDLARSGESGAALALQQQLIPVSRLLGSLHGVAGLKAAMQIVGCDLGPPRPPLRPLSDQGVAAIHTALAAFTEVHYEPAT